MMFGMFDPRIDNCGFMLAPLYKPFLNFCCCWNFSDKNLKIIVYALCVRLINCFPYQLQALTRNGFKLSCKKYFPIRRTCNNKSEEMSQKRGAIIQQTICRKQTLACEGLIITLTWQFWNENFGVFFWFFGFFLGFLVFFGFF